MNLRLSASIYNRLKRLTANSKYPKSFYKRAVRHNLNASTSQNKLQKEVMKAKLATSREYKVQERESQLSNILILIFDA